MAKQRIFGVDFSSQQQLEALRDQVAAGDRTAIKLARRIIEASDQRAQYLRAEKGDSTATLLAESYLRNRTTEQPDSPSRS